MDDDGPDFGYAFGSQPTTPLWNPAFRPDTPGIEQMKPQQRGEAELASVQNVLHSNEAAFAQNGMVTSDKETQAAPDRDPVPPAPISREDAQPLERAPSYTPLYPNSTAEDATYAAEPPPEAHAPDELYEPQSESTFLDDALQERPSAPLIEDDANAMDWGQAGDDFGLSAPTEAVQTEERTITQVPAAEPETGREATDDLFTDDKAPEIDWGTRVEEDPLFGQGDDNTSKEQGLGMEWPDDVGDDFAIGQSKETNAGNKSQEADMSAWEAAFGDDELLEDENANRSTGPAFFEDDGEGFLDGPVAAPTNAAASVAANVASASSASKYSPASPQVPVQTQNKIYAPQGSQFTDLSQLSRSSSTPQTSLDGYQQVPAYGAARPQIKPAADGKSFSDKAKTGYASPYDLPEDLSKAPRRRPAGVGAARQAQATPPAPPPRTSSYGFPPPQELSRIQSNASVGSIAQNRPPSSGSAYQPSQGSQSRKASLDKPPSAPSAGSSGFFEDLPMTARLRREPSGRYTPSATPQPQQTPTFMAGPPQQMQQHAPPPPNPYGQFRQPDRPVMFPEQPTVPAPAPPQLGGAPSTRYSPAPGSAPSAGMAVPPMTGPRYSPVPPPQAAGSQAADRYASAQVGSAKPPVKPFAPRTASPLAQSTSAQQQDEYNAPDLGKALPQQPGQNHQLQQQYEPSAHTQQGAPYQNGYNATPPVGTKPTITPPPEAQPPQTASPRKRSTYTPSNQLPLVPETAVVPPTRSQSGSPGSSMRNSKLAFTPVDRPASAYDLPSPQRATAPLAQTFSLPHRRGFSQELNFIPPQDEQVHDPLERWKGRPIFNWGPAGHVVTSFPKHIPRYGGGQAAPMIKAAPGEPKLQNVKDIIGADDILTGFPGPLKKGKKKEVVAWLKNAISILEKQTQMTAYQVAMPQDAKKSQEKLILWKIMLVLVENDGVLEGTPAIQDAVRAVLTDEDSSPPPPIGLSASDPGTAPAPSSHGITSEAVNPNVVHSIREHLAKGDREKAAWLAVDERLWGHAMLISSTLSKDIWGQVIQEFVRKEVKTAGSGNEPLAALYEVFAGNWEDSIDQLVPASARAGFQMISTIDVNAGNKDALAGLDKWKGTLLLILSNRSTDDTQALLALGKLLAEYGRTEAAHTCYMFARQAIYFGGADDPQANLTLVGADARFHVDFGKDMESILLSEVYEFASSMSASTTSTIPHLQPYKVYHALALAEAGLSTEARHYCDHIVSLIGSKTKLSPYYNPYFISTLDDLVKRLNQTPSSSSSIFSKPNMKHVSSSIFTKFNSFVAGDETDTASNGSGQQEVGPFARISGDTPPTISRTTSLQDMYGSYNNGGPVGGGAQPAGRYAPAAPTNAYAPRTSLDQGRPQQFNQYAPQSARTSLESVRPGEAAYSPAVSDNNLYTYGSPPHQQQASQPSNYSPTQQRLHPQQVARAASYQGTTGVNGQHAPALTPYTPPTNAYSPSPYAMTPEPESAAPLPDQQRQPSPQLQHTNSYSYEPQVPAQPEAAGYEALPAEPPSQASFDDQQGGYQPPTSSYEPPASSYEAPSYQPYEPDAEATTQQPNDDAPQPKKKSFMDDDDDDDLAKRAAALKLEGKSKADREADDAFKKAAEADANRPPPGQQRSSWFGGWFKKDQNAPQQGPIKAKLGEESSFVYDPELKRWVDKKNPTATPAAAATPPPPKGPMGGMRAASGTPPPGAGLAAPPTTGMRAASGPPLGGMPPRAPSTVSVPTAQPTASGPPSRVGTPGSVAADAAALPAIGVPGLPGGGGPPSRPPTSMSNASSIDDLIGPAAGRKGAAKKKGRGGRYVDVMANQG